MILRTTFTRPLLVASIAFLLGAPALAYTLDDCRKISERARAENVKVMVIGIEGLLQMNPDAFAEMESYNRKIRAGQKNAVPADKYCPYDTVAPTGQSGVTRGFMIPLMRSHGSRIEPLIVGEDSVQPGARSIARSCARIWKQEDPERKLIIVGHSYGGAAALDLAKALAEDEVTVDVLTTIDPVSRPFKALSAAPNVTSMANYWQPGLPRPGESLPFAGTNQQLDSYDIECPDGKKRVALGHMNIPGHPAILQDVRAKIEAYLREQEAKPKPATGGKTKKAKPETPAGVQ